MRVLADITICSMVGRPKNINVDSNIKYIKLLIKSFLKLYKCDIIILNHKNIGLNDQI